MIFYGLNSIIDESFAKQNDCIPLRFVQDCLEVAYLSNEKSEEIITQKCMEQGIKEIRLIPAGLNEILRLINQYYSIELKNIEIYKRIRYLLKQGAFEELLHAIICYAKKFGASDIHISTEEKYCFIKLRINGKIKTLSVIDENHAQYLYRVIKVKGNNDISKTLKPIDSSFILTIEGQETSIRTALVNTISGEKASLRLLDNDNIPKSLGELGLENEELSIIKKHLSKASGTILVTGPTGSGKSTTVRCFLDEINDGSSHIITVEDPIEYSIGGITQIQVEGKTNGFAQAVKSILRQDPDVIYIGEIRDEISADVATKASITGHLVFSTLHTKSAESAVERLEGLGIDKNLIVNSLSLVINQRLIAEQCPHCLIGHKYKGEDIPALGVSKGQDIFESSGCGKCDYSGIKRRVPLVSLIEFDEEFKVKYLSGEKDFKANDKTIQTIKDRFNKNEISLSEAKRFV